MSWKEDRREQYMQKLRDPRWQKKRLEVMERDEFRCQICFDDKSTLNVHHNYYKSGMEPWDYPLTALVTLCETCHEEETQIRPQEEKILLDVLRLIGMRAGHINGLMSQLYATFGENPQFSDNWDQTIYLFLRYFWELQPVIHEFVKAEREKRQHEAKLEQ